MLPKRGAFWINLTNKKINFFYSNQYCGRCVEKTQKDFSKYLYIALGSASETEYLILLSYELNYIKEIEYKKVLFDVQEIKK